MTQPELQPNNKAASPFETLLEALDADALFAARGDIGSTGNVTIRRPYLAAIGATKEFEITEEFVEGYELLAPHDVVGILFAADSRVVERVSASQYDMLKGAGNSKSAQAWNRKIRDYLRDAGFEHLILAGLRSKRHGLAWVVAYRGPLKQAFSEKDAEKARYEVPQVLFEVLRSADKDPPTGTKQNKEAPGRLIPIDADRLRVAILEAQGFGPSAIGKKLRKSISGIKNSLTYVRTLLNVPMQQRITMQHLEHYAGEVSDEQALADEVRLEKGDKTSGQLGRNST